MMIRKLVGITLMVTVSLNVYGVKFSERTDVQTFINSMVVEHQFDRQILIKTFENFESSDDIIKKITKPAESLTWDRYRGIFLNEKRIKNGVLFWDKHQESLTQAERKYGTPASVIVAIIGVETLYGESKGNYPVLQALATLAFDYPQRAAFFRQELREYLLLTRDQKIDPITMTGSYAGAIGVPQFMPSSYRKFAVDFDNSGSIDLVNNVTQSIGSVSNYLQKHGWQANQPIAHQAIINGEQYKKLAIAKYNAPLPNIDLSILRSHGVDVKTKLMPENTKSLSFIEFVNDNGKEYWLGEQNFYAITRYNHSSSYAMAVHQLSEAIKTQRAKH
jgi:membrane-bound lytic murein transglycosylase B